MTVSASLFINWIISAALFDSSMFYKWKQVVLLVKSAQEAIELVITVAKRCFTNAIKRNWAVTYQSYLRETLDGPEQMEAFVWTPLHL